MDNRAIEQRSDEWLDIRKGKFTGSEIYKLMTEPKSKNDLFSETAKSYIYQKIAEQYSSESLNTISSPAIDWGIENEPLAKKWYEKTTGNKVTDVTFIHHKLFPLDCGGSPDGYCEENNSIIEIKCPYNSTNHIKYVIIPAERMKQECKEYYWQMQFYMAIMSADYCDFISFDKRIDADFGLHIKRIDRNDADILLMNEKIAMAIDYKQQITKLLY